MQTTTTEYYAVVTFGSPTHRICSYYRNPDRAYRDACMARGTGSCTNARVVRCPSRKAACEADISDSWPVVATA